MLYILIITTECNRSCQYCGGKLNSMPKTIKYNTTELIDFLKRDTKPIIAFYGGEPLLQPTKIKEIIDTIPASHFILNTNGTNLHKLENYLKKIDTILISTDGRPETTDYYRGNGCNTTIQQALSYLKTNKYSGELIARMTISYHTDIYQDVNYLLTKFPKVHWQLDAIWSTQWNLPEFKKWAETSYKPGLNKLITQFNQSLQQNQIQHIIPFIGIITRILHGGNGLPCQSGTESITITTDGQILACPIAPEFSWNQLGNFKNYTTTTIGPPCTTCEIYNECGGRCLFSHKERLWGKEGFTTICNLTKYLVKELKKHIELYKQHPSLFQHPPYNNTTEIIP